MGFVQAYLCLLVAAVVTADYQGPSDYRRPQTSYGTPAPWYGGGGGSGGGGPYRGSSAGSGYNADERPKSYQFGYAVRDYASGNDFGRHETSDGDTVTGEYRVQLPDGRTQIVTYTADWQHGFQANVKYEGEAFYPDKNTYNNNNYNNQNNNHYQGGGSSGSFGGGNNYGSHRKGGSSFGHDSFSNPGSSYSSPGSSYSSPGSSYSSPGSSYRGHGGGYDKWKR